ncbi:MAG: MFS transporter [Nitrospirae bacterium]|nr:MFS transporter [Nitrospirota bacterium]
MKGQKGQEPEKSLSYAIRDGSAFAVMTGIGEAYLSAFAIFLKATNTQIGLLASIPPLLGAPFQLLSVRVLNFLKDRKRIIVSGVVLQAFVWIAVMALLLAHADLRVQLLIAAVTFYYIFGNFATPAWNSLMGDLVPPETRGTYFARRTRIISLMTFGALVLGGVILHYAEIAQWTALGFILIFAIAFLARGFSSYYLSRMANPPYDFREEHDFSLREFLSQTRHSNFARFVFYTGFMHFSVMIAGPFFSVYMLRDLHFSYLQFMVTLAISVLFQFVILQYWGPFSDRFGNKKLLILSSFGLPFLPWLWLISPNFYWVLFVQMVAGIVWAGFSLNISNFIYDAVPSPMRAKCVAINNLAIAVGTFCGAYLGGGITKHLPQDFTLFGTSWHLISNLQWLFLISGALRLFFALVFLPLIREVRDVEPLSVRDLFYRVVQMRPLSGLRFDLFTGGRKEKE